MDELRIPPGVTFQFEKVLALVAEHARLGATDWAIRSHELMGQFEHRWREGIEMGLSTNDASTRALEMFGDPEAVGRRFRKNSEWKLLFSRDWQWIRIIVFLIATYCAIKANRDALLSQMEVDASSEMEFRKVLGNEGKGFGTAASGAQLVALILGDFTFYNLACLNSVMAVAAPFWIASLAARSKRPRFSHPLAIALMLPVTLGALYVVAVPIWHASLAYFKYIFPEALEPGMFRGMGLWPQFVFALFWDFIYIGVGALGATCLLCEALELNSKWKRQFMKTIRYPLDRPRILLELLMPPALGGLIVACFLLSMGEISSFYSNAILYMSFATYICVLQSISCTILIEIAYMHGLEKGSALSCYACGGLGMLSGVIASIMFGNRIGNSMTLFALLGTVAGAAIAVVVRFFPQLTDAKTSK